MATAQTAINNMRIQLAETDPTNSRWQDDPDLLFYLNQGRRQFAKESKAIKNIFQQTTVQGPTLAGQNLAARYVLDPLVWDIDNVFWDQFEIEAMGTEEWEEAIAAREMRELGVPYIYRRIGDSIDLFFAPNEQKTLEIHASIIPSDLTALNATETDLKDDQLQAAVDYATFLALTDDDRDGSIYVQKFKAVVKEWKGRVHRKGPRMVNIVRDFWWIT